MKKLMLIVLSFAISTMIYAHGGNAVFNSQERYADTWQEMDEMHDIMHNTLIKGENSENGVVFQITSNSESALSKINESFVEDSEKLQDFFRGVTVNVEAIDNGVKLNLTSSDDLIVKRLQAYGSRSVYQFLHSTFEFGRFGKGFHGHGPGMMRGYSGQQGFHYGPCHGYEFPNES